MAIYSGAWIYKDVEIMLWLDPNRYRITIWGLSSSGIYSKKLRRMHDKNKQRILKRAFEWVDKAAIEVIKERC